MRPFFAISCLVLTLISRRLSLGSRLDDRTLDVHTAPHDTDAFSDDHGNTNILTGSKLYDAFGQKEIPKDTLYHYYARIYFADPNASQLELELIGGFRIRIMPEGTEELREQMELPDEDRCLLVAEREGATTAGGLTSPDWKLAQHLTLRGLLEELFGSESNRDPVVAKHIQEEYTKAEKTWQIWTMTKRDLERPYHATWYNCQVFMEDVVKVAVPSFGNIFHEAFVNDAREITGVSGSQGTGSAIYGALATAATQAKVPDLLKGTWGSIWDKLLQQRSFAHYTYDALQYLRDLPPPADFDGELDFDKEMARLKRNYNDPPPDSFQTLKQYAGLVIDRLEVWASPVTPLAKVLTHTSKIEDAYEKMVQKLQQVQLQMK